jgi:hypothetical protein
MSVTNIGYRNFEDGDECGFVAPKAAHASSTPTSAEIDSPRLDRILMALKRPMLEERIILLDRGQRWMEWRLDELLEQPLTPEVIRVLQEMRRVQARNVERYEALIAEMVPEHSSSVRTTAA